MDVGNSLVSNRLLSGQVFLFCPRPKVGAKAKGGDVKGDKKEVKKLSKEPFWASKLGRNHHLNFNVYFSTVFVGLSIPQVRDVPVSLPNRR